MSIESREIDAESGDGHRFKLIARVPADARHSLLWLPALGIAAKHYIPLADSLAARGVTVILHEWRGNGSSTLRADATHDWGYRALLVEDIPASERLVAAITPGLPRIVGGHSLGGQLACCHLALQPGSANAIWLAGSGAPYWRAFPFPQRLWLPLAYRFLPWLAQRRGYLPGRAIRFGGNEARSLIRDWSRTAIAGRYHGEGIDVDLEAALSRVSAPIRAAVFEHDWLAPESSTRFLLSKLPLAEAHVSRFDVSRLGTTPDHYAWMKRPEAVADWFTADSP